jgi:hypothetical protein
MSEQWLVEKMAALNLAFVPSGPISRKDMFKGRSAQITEALAAVLRPSEHLVIVGERGVGKSSLANIIFDIIAGLSSQMPAYRYGKVNCGDRETFDSLWREVLRTVKFTHQEKRVGFSAGPSPEPQSVAYTLSDTLPDQELTPARVVGIIKGNPGIWVFDEFNTLRKTEAQPFSDLIKALSDAGSQAKVVLVGVADSLAQLLRDHSSVERSVPNAIFATVLLACALAKKDPFGYFKMSDVTSPLSKLRKRRVVAGTFATHLAAFCSEERGAPLCRRGARHNYAYRFTNPLLQPYTVLKGLVGNQLKEEWLGALATSNEGTEARNPTEQPPA